MRYDDIINISNPPLKHQRMSMHKRAAQFSPFAALTGYEDSIDEAARLTNVRPELSDDEKKSISDKLIYLKDNPYKIKVVYFLDDPKKDGGDYFVYSGMYKRCEEGYILFEDKKKIYLDDIIEIILEE